MADHAEGVAGRAQTVFVAAEHLLGHLALEPAEQQADQIQKAQPGMVELAHRDADHPDLAEAIQAEAAEDVVQIMGRIDPVVDVIGIGFKVREECRLREEIDVVTQGIEHRHIGVAEAAPGQGAQGLHVVRAAEPALADQGRRLGMAAQDPFAQPHRRRIPQAMGHQKRIGRFFSRAGRQIRQFQKVLQVLAGGDAVEIAEAQGVSSGRSRG